MTANGEKLLDDIEQEIRRFIWLPNEKDYAVVTAWIAYTHSYDVFDHAPRLALHSDLPGSGKTELLRVLTELAPRGQHVVSVRPATLYRHVHDRRTLFIDEMDKHLGRGMNAEVHEILNAGHTRGVTVARSNMSEGANYEQEYWEPFGPVAFGILGKKLPDDLAQRCIPVQMERGNGNVKYEKFRSACHAERLQELQKELSKFAECNKEALLSASPKMHGLQNRSADNWEPLFAIADIAGGRWPERLGIAAICYEKGKPQTDRALVLLQDIRELLVKKLVPVEGGFVKTDDLLKALNEEPEWSWGELQHGEGLSAHALAKLLKQIKGPKPEQRKRGGPRGYYKEDLQVAMQACGLPPILHVA